MMIVMIYERDDEDDDNIGTNIAFASVNKNLYRH